MDGSNVPAPQARRFAANMRAIAGAMGRACVAGVRATARARLGGQGCAFLRAMLKLLFAADTKTGAMACA
jgi:hypothetical protein